MMAQTKYKIGEFSRLGRVTVRTLRHYEKIGLLKPGIPSSRVWWPPKRKE